MPKVAKKIQTARPAQSTRAEGPPKYERVRQYFVDELSAGRLKPGDLLPTEQQLAATWSIARSTVRQAMAALERDGLIQRIQGRGTFIHEQAKVLLKNGLDVLALLLPETQTGFYPSLQQSFDESAWRYNNQILVCQSNNDVDRQGNVILQLIDKEVAGVAIVTVTSPATPAFQIRQLQKAQIPVVFCHRRVEGIRAPLLAIPFREVGRLAGRALVEQGHTRVAFFSAHTSEAGKAYLAGLTDVLAPGGKLDERDIFFGTSSTSWIDEQELAPALKQLLERSDRPTAIFASFDSVAESIYLQLMRLGVRVPQDISLLGFGGIARSTATLRSLSSVTVDETQIARQAVELLEQMRRRELPLDHDETFVMPIGLSAGQTLGPARRSGK
jgi:DNA-binding LacI/PurR family transcriptional regulator